jgi:hypothetical protein
MLWLGMAGCSSRLLIIAIAYLSNPAGRQFLVLEDAVHLYVNCAMSLAEDGQFSANYTHMPVYPVLLAAVRLVSGLSGIEFQLLVGALHSVFFGALCVLTAKVAEGLLGPRAGILAAAGLILVPDMWPYAVMIMPDCLHACLIMAGTLLGIQAMRGRRHRAVAAAALLGFSVWVKPAGALVGFGLVCVFVLASPVTAHRARLALAALAAFSIWILVPIAYNHAVHDTPTLSTQSGLYAYEWVRRNMLADAGIDWRSVKRTEPEHLPENLTAIQRSALLGKVARQDILRRPHLLLGSIASRAWRLFAGTGSRALLNLPGFPPPTDTIKHLPAPLPSARAWWRDYPSAWPFVLQITSWGLLLALFLSAIARAVRLACRREWLTVTIAAIGIGLAAALVLNIPHTRYRCPMNPFLAILAGAVLSRTTPKRRGREAIQPQGSMDPTDCEAAPPRALEGRPANFRPDHHAVRPESTGRQRIKAPAKESYSSATVRRSRRLFGLASSACHGGSPRG